MVDLYGIVAGRLHWDPVVALVSGTSESLYRCGSDPDVPQDLRLHRHDLGGKIGHFGYSEALMITLLTNFLKASSIVGALSIRTIRTGVMAVSQTPTRLTVHF